MRKSVLLGAAVIAVLAVGAVIFAVARGARERPARDDEGEARAAPDEAALDDDDGFDWMDPEDTPVRARVRRRDGTGPGPVSVMGGPGGGDDGRRRFQEMTEEEREAFREARRARFREHVDLASLGPGELAITADDLIEPFRDARRATRECVRELGDDARGLWRQARGDGRELAFELDANGAYVPGSFAATPALPPELARCFEQGFQTMQTETPPGPDGARVSMEMPARGSFSPDGGVRGFGRRGGFGGGRGGGGGGGGGGATSGGGRPSVQVSAPSGE